MRERIVVVRRYIENLEEVKIFNVYLVNKRRRQKSEASKDINYSKEINIRRRRRRERLKINRRLYIALVS